MPLRALFKLISRTLVTVSTDQCPTQVHFKSILVKLWKDQCLTLTHFQDTEHIVIQSIFYTAVFMDTGHTVKGSMPDTVAFFRTRVTLRNDQYPILAPLRILVALWNGSCIYIAKWSIYIFKETGHIVKGSIHVQDILWDNQYTIPVYLWILDTQWKDHCSILMHFQDTGPIVNRLIFGAFKDTGHIVKG